MLKIGKLLGRLCGFRSAGISRQFHENQLVRRSSQVVAPVTAREILEQQVGESGSHVFDHNGGNIEFQSSRIAFGRKTNKEIVRAYFVFKLCGWDWVVDNEEKLRKWTQTLVGERGFRWLMRKTFFGQFCGGLTADESIPVVQRNLSNGVGPIWFYSAESDLGSATDNDEMFDKVTGEFINSVDAISDHSEGKGYSAIKVTAMVNANLLETLNTVFEENPELKHGSLEAASKHLDISDRERMAKLVDRLDAICERVQERDVKVIVDAEQTYFQEGINFLTVEMMRRYNTKKTRIVNTYQCYLKKGYERISADIEIAKAENFGFGAKPVRGCYMEQERAFAEAMGYEDPINPDFDSTTKMYSRVIEHCLNNLQERPSNMFHMLIASHNEESVKTAIRWLYERDINPDDGQVAFGQLVGVCDHVSFTLGHRGYPVFKVTPYGTIEELIPFLARRAQENRSIIEKAQKERGLIWEEFKRRFIPFSGSSA